MNLIRHQDPDDQDTPTYLRVKLTDQAQEEDHDDYGPMHQGLHGLANHRKSVNLRTRHGGNLVVLMASMALDPE